jgi:type II secretory pathway component GspD/PulD (secretin)
MKIWALVATVCCVAARCATAYGADGLVVLDLRYRSAQDLLPALKPLVGPDTSLSGIDYKLLIRGSSADVARVREALAVLDRAPRQLLVTVRYGGGSRYQRDAANVNGVANSSTAHDSRLTLEARSALTTRGDESVATLRVLEGNGAFISAGASVPMVSAIAVGRRGTATALQYRELGEGFDVLPRINGDRVVLEVNGSMQSANGAGVDTQRLSTAVSGRVGEWIALGASDWSAARQRNGLGARSTRTQSDRRSVEIKVDVLE